MSFSITSRFLVIAPGFWASPMNTSSFSITSEPDTGGISAKNSMVYSVPAVIVTAGLNIQESWAAFSLPRMKAYLYPDTPLSGVSPRPSVPADQWSVS